MSNPSALLIWGGGGAAIAHFAMHKNWLLGAVIGLVAGYAITNMMPNSIPTVAAVTIS